jgi:hypothetical protein
MLQRRLKHALYMEYTFSISLTGYEVIKPKRVNAPELLSFAYIAWLLWPMFLDQRLSNGKWPSSQRSGIWFKRVSNEEFSHMDFLLGLFFDPEDGGDIVLRNVR